MRNSGNKEWPDGCYLNVKGEVEGFCPFVPALNPGEEGDIVALVSLPLKAGLY